MERACDLVDYALRLKAGIRALAAESDGLGLQIRVSLHAGPVFPGIDPFHERPNFYGAHINRAARLEPVTVPGQIYATQQFVALLTAEESALASEARLDGADYCSAWICEYVGVLMLAKKFGNQPVYHIREAVGMSGTT
jgi:class 3 adenylate cyclase